jgi:Trpc4-associated protein
VIQDVQAFLSSEVSEFATTMSVNGSALESLYNTVSDFRGPSSEDIQANNTRPEMRVIMDLASQQRVAGTSLMDDRVVDWNIMLLDRTGLSTGVIHLATHHVEVLFVLCALCGGKKREQVQNQLAKLGLVGVLTNMFDKLDWKASQPRSSSRGIHGIGCACNPKSVSWV